MTATDETEADDYTFLRPGKDPVCSNFARLDRLQAQNRPYLRAEEPANNYWVMTDHDAILEGFQKPEFFSSSVMVPIDPNPPYKWIPVMLDPPEHNKWRHLLGLYFSPRRVKTAADQQRKFAIDLIEKFRASGSCDFYSDFAAIYPTTIFLQIMGLPIDKLPDFMEWEDKILHPDPATDPDLSKQVAAMMEVVGYFSGLISERRNDPSSRGDDIVSHAIDWDIDGEKPKDEDLLSCMLLLFMAGLDTVAAQLSYSFWHLATHPADRRRIVDDPEMIPGAIEELLRAYPIVQSARKATQDIEFHGCPIKKGDMVSLPLAMAGRDPKVFERGGTVDFDAPRPRHISFGAGPHRCLGSHLARQELQIVLEEWHRLIPDYEIGGDEVTLEHIGGVFGIDKLPLQWKV
ncbi:cytochrome P450 [Mycobacterium sp. SMC-8]|uniref:cytochrome P450 n=1 Tax=Mycobacterium sp. SMC-8 TaxID=2857060 RepID=UPI0021B2EB85|nr:cytochrome P450 [Mycobacterium sp. SMC-8]UXA11574.1 cytochrome P450 [Mycobacterium sp. SMC-8]